MSYRLSPQAELELEEIGDHICRRQLRPIRLIALIERASAVVYWAQYRAGRPELRPICVVSFGAYLILYRAIDSDSGDRASCTRREILMI